MTELNLDDLTADKIHSYLKQQKDQKKAAEAVAAERAREEREQIRKKFEAEDVPADALQHVFGMVRKAVERGDKEVMVLHFRSDFLPDSGRRISIGSKDWTEHLNGFAAGLTAFTKSNCGRAASRWPRPSSTFRVVSQAMWVSFCDGSWG